MNTHPDYMAGPRNNYAQDLIRDFTFDDTLTWIKSGWRGDHTFKAGVAYSRNGALPQGTAVNFTGLYDFLTNAPFNAANPTHLSVPLPASAWASSTSTEIDHQAQRVHPGQVAGQQEG